MVLPHWSKRATSDRVLRPRQWGGRKVQGGRNGASSGRRLPARPRSGPAARRGWEDVPVDQEPERVGIPMPDGAAPRRRHPCHSKPFTPEHFRVPKSSGQSPQRQTHPQQPEKDHEFPRGRRCVLFQAGGWWRLSQRPGRACRRVPAKRRTASKKVTRQSDAWLSSLTLATPHEPAGPQASRRPLLSGR